MEFYLITCKECGTQLQGEKWALDDILEKNSKVICHKCKSEYIEIEIYKE